MLFLSAISSARDGELIVGKVGRDVGLVEAQLAARRAAENLIAVLSEALDGDLSRVEAVLLLRGHVNATDDFPDVHKVVDSASDVFIEILGEKGRHARTAIGCATLPNLNTVTLDAIVVLVVSQP